MDVVDEYSFTLFVIFLVVFYSLGRVRLMHMVNGAFINPAFSFVVFFFAYIIIMIYNNQYWKQKEIQVREKYILEGRLLQEGIDKDKFGVKN